MANCISWLFQALADFFTKLNSLVIVDGVSLLSLIYGLVIMIWWVEYMLFGQS